jgi:hypothetical protein
VDVPVQFFQSVIGIEVAVAGALLFQIRFFEPAAVVEGPGSGLPAPWQRLLLAVVLGATVFGSLYAIATGGQRGEATAVTLGLAASVVPLLLRVLRPLSSSPAERAVTAAGVVLYAFVVTVVIALLNG